MANLTNFALNDIPYVTGTSPAALQGSVLEQRGSGLFVDSGSSMTFTGAGGYIQAASSITTTGTFFGDGSGLTGIAVFGSSDSANTFNIPTAFNVASTETVTLKGGRPVFGFAQFQLTNGTVATTYSFKVTRDGTAVSKTYQTTGPKTAGDLVPIGFFFFETSSTQGTVHYQLQIQGTSVAGTPTATNMQVIATEILGN